MPQETDFSRRSLLKRDPMKFPFDQWHMEMVVLPLYEEQQARTKRQHKESTWAAPTSHLIISDRWLIWV